MRSCVRSYRSIDFSSLRKLVCIIMALVIAIPAPLLGQQAGGASTSLKPADIPDDLLFSAFLDQLQGKVDQIIDHAAASADEVLIRAGSEVDAEINNFRNAYADLLNKTMKEVKQPLDAEIGELNSDASALEQQTAAGVAPLADTTG